MQREIFAGLLSVLAAGCAGFTHPAVSPQLRPVAVQHVIYSDSEWLGRRALKLALTSEEQERQLAGAGGNRPTFIILGTDFSDGAIEVDIAAGLNGRGGEDARGFAGIAFHIDDALEKFEAVYLRFSNGTLNVPPPPAPRDMRAIQYVAHPGFHFQEFRIAAPGHYEKPAAVALGRWHRIRIEIENTNLTAAVDGLPVLQIGDLKYAGQSGQFGIWVGDGSDAYVANLKVIRD